MKWFVWLVKSIIRIAVVAGLSLFSAWFVVNMYVEEIMKNYHIPNVGNKIQFTDVLARLGEDWHIVKTRTSNSSASPAEGDRTAPVAAQPVPGGGSDVPSGGSSPTGKPSQAEEHVPEDAVAVTGRLRQSTGTGGGTLGDMVMSTDDFAKKKAAMSSDDKMKLFSLLVGKIPPDELQSISTMVEDGITGDELKQLDTKLQKYLSKDEYKQILDIIAKY